MVRILSSFVVLTLVLIPIGAEAGKKKKKADEPPPVGWQTQEGWAGSCYYPPDFPAMTSSQRRMAWQTTRNEIMAQWQGQKGDGVTFNDKAVVNLETALLGKPERIEAVAKDNLEQCLAAMKKSSFDAWGTWLTGETGRLTVGECPYAPLDYTLFDYLSIHDDWQIPANVCKDDYIKLKGSSMDYFKLEKGGPWINVDGDTARPASGPELPCNVEGCFVGQLVMRFTGDDGVKTVVPIGTGADFMVPSHGKIQVMINVSEFEDNVWKVEGGLEHHSSIEYAPVKK
jgi:hypothetical protein